MVFSRFFGACHVTEIRTRDNRGDNGAIQAQAESLGDQTAAGHYQHENMHQNMLMDDSSPFTSPGGNYKIDQNATRSIHATSLTPHDEFDHPQEHLYQAMGDWQRPTYP